MDHIGVSVHLLMDMGCFQPGQLFIWRQDLSSYLPPFWGCLLKPGEAASAWGVGRQPLHGLVTGPSF